MSFPVSFYFALQSITMTGGNHGCGGGDECGSSAWFTASFDVKADFYKSAVDEQMDRAMDGQTIIESINPSICNEK